MPIYEFKCSKCEHTFEVMGSYAEREQPHSCPQCGSTEVKQAIEQLFKVKVVDVKTAIVRGKFRRIGRNEGKRPNWKKAIVTLKEGDAISLFEGK